MWNLLCLLPKSVHLPLFAWCITEKKLSRHKLVVIKCLGIQDVIHQAFCVQDTLGVFRNFSTALPTDHQIWFQITRIPDKGNGGMAKCSHDKLKLSAGKCACSIYINGPMFYFHCSCIIWKIGSKLSLAHNQIKNGNGHVRISKLNPM